MLKEPNCYKRQCIHFVGVIQKNEEERTEQPNCLAFPTGIPHEIAYGSNQHLIKYKGQTANFVFEKR